jgi:undecaprenyl diphosphate synthase
MRPSALTSATPAAAHPPLHVAIIMDGNGRWALARGMPRVAGHRAGGGAVRRTVEAAPRLGVGTLTLYAFSSDNWRRPAREVAALMRLFRSHLRTETPDLVRNGVRLSIIGRRDRLPMNVRAAIAQAERATAHGRTLHLRVAVDYSSREILVGAARRARARPKLSREEFAQLIAEEYGGTGPAPDVDLLIRTGGEQRLSDFMLWEAAYAELVFTDRMWPDFGADDLGAAVTEFLRRERRFGALPAAAAS